MTGPSEDDRAAVDRAFAAMIAGYHLTADRPGSESTESSEVDVTADLVEAAERPAVVTDPAPADDPDPHWADNHPLFRFPAEPASVAAPAQDAEAISSGPSTYVPEPLPPLGRPAGPTLLGWLGIGWAVLVVLAAAFGARFPAWVGWAAVVGFLVGFAVLISRLPRHRPPDSGDGAVL